LTKTRFITGLIFIPLIVILIQLGGWPYLTALTVFTLLAMWEFVQMMTVKGHHPNMVLSLAFVVVMILVVQLGFPDPSAVMILFAMLTLGWALFQDQSKTDAPVIEWALTVTGAIYIGFGMSLLMVLRNLPEGYAWVWLVILSTWGGDTLAYFGGRRFGRRKFWPRLSPKKTWEGIVAGFIGSLLGGSLVLLFSNIHPGHVIVVALLAATFGPLGDISVSMMKRYAGVKDSSNILPGHGGILDRVDSLLAVIIVTHYYVMWVVL
jgi:phosphatidate cytidylyltransferase